ncbi:MAG: hypothetical protein JW746_00120 [Candidatus Krumholzibacteriota bacterium]|nr:hypothetical protein [Candidatus Krumholzibacteriota bacterium]
MHLAKAFKVVLAVVALMLFSSLVFADHCLILYPAGPCIYEYDESEYTLIGPGDPGYDALSEFSLEGVVLVAIKDGAIDEAIYQAPELRGFRPSRDGKFGYVFDLTEFTLVVDGFSGTPTTYENILLIFDGFVPAECIPTVYFDYELLTNFTVPIGDLVVSTPTDYGNNYSDILTFDVVWSGCYGLHIWAFADENHNGQRDGGECFTAYSHDILVPAEEASWGKIKILDRD